MIRKIPGIILALVILVLPLSAAYAGIPEQPTDNFYVNDYANVLSDTTMDHIINKNIEIEERSGSQIVVVTVDFTDGMEMEDYCVELFNTWEIGSADKNNGFLLLLSIGDDDYYGLEGEGLERILSAGTIDQILYENLEPDFAVQDYDAGVLKTFDAIWSVLDKQYPQSSSAANTNANTGYESSAILFTIIPFLVILLIIFVFILIVALFSQSSRRRRAMYYPPGHPYHRPRRGFFAPRHHPPHGHNHMPSPPMGGTPNTGGGLFSGGGGSTRGGGAGRNTSSSSYRGTSSSSSSRSTSRPSGGSSRSSSSPRSSGGGTRGGGSGRRK